MALEIEAKIRVDTHQPTREALEAAGASLVSNVVERNIILDHKELDLQSKGCGLRIRSAHSTSSSESPKVTVTYKGPALPGAFKQREEIEFHASESSEVEVLFSRLGFSTVLAYEKLRETWRLDNCLVELDTPPHLGCFVEIEGESEDAVRRVQEKIGLSDSPHVSSSYVRMLFEYCQDNALDPTKLCAV